LASSRGPPLLQDIHLRAQFLDRLDHQGEPPTLTLQKSHQHPRRTICFRRSRAPPSTGSIAGPGIAVSRACRRSEGCQAGSQSGDQFLLLLDRSDQGGHRRVGFDVPGGVDGHMMSGAILKVEQPFAREGQDQRPPLANREVDKAMVSTSMPSPPLGPNNARIAGHQRFSSQNIIFGRQQQSAAVRIEVGSKPCGHPNNLCISKL